MSDNVNMSCHGQYIRSRLSVFLPLLIIPCRPQLNRIQRIFVVNSSVIRVINIWCKCLLEYVNYIIYHVPSNLHLVDNWLQVTPGTKRTHCWAIAKAFIGFTTFSKASTKLRLEKFWWTHVTYSSIFFRAASLALGRFCNNPGTIEATLMDVGKVDQYKTMTESDYLQV